jgi:hypothetical protein
MADEVYSAKAIVMLTKYKKQKEKTKKISLF